MPWGAAGSIEAVISVLALRDQVVPPTINLDHPGDDCDLDYVPHNASLAGIGYTVSLVNPAAGSPYL